MSNSWFQFKEFNIQQEHCGMKVSTDACIQGAWTEIAADVAQVLDIGAGTGLLSLMLAQRASWISVDALELDENAAKQAAENVAQAPFAKQIKVQQVDVTQWLSPKKYELIICNPPFFQKSMKGPDVARNAARHGDSLSPESLLKAILERLSAKGTASIMWPEVEQELFQKLAARAGLFLNKKIEIKDQEQARISRVIGIYRKEEYEEPLVERLVIKDEDKRYTEEFIRLLHPFYLHL